MTDVAEGKCDACGQAAKQFCASCKAIYYCSRECQKKGWKSHKPNCRPFIVKNHEEYGRYIIATREIKAGEVILKEAPLILGPKQCTFPLCLGCHKKMTSNALCNKCHFPVCSPSCQSSIYHKTECPILAQGSSRLDFTDLGSPNPAYECITPLRGLILKKTDNDKWKRVTTLQSHLEDIKKTPVYGVNQRNIVEFIRQFLGKKDDDYDEELIHEICGILFTNSFELIHNGQRIRGLYEKASMFAHNCVANTKHAFDTSKNIIFRATQNIARGSPIFVTYTQSLWDTYSRRQHLKNTKYFWCQCHRCDDPTELGTNISTLLCTNCGGDITSTQPLDADALWMCSACGHDLLGKQISWGNDMMNREIRTAGRADPLSLENFIERYKGTLHYNHRFNVEAKYALVKYYGNSPDCRYRDLSQEQIENKVKWCQELLELADSIEPCKSHFRGTILFELQAAMVAKAKYLLSNDLITQEKAAEHMNNAVGHLQEASEILRHDPQMAEGGLDEKLKILSEELEI